MNASAPSPPLPEVALLTQREADLRPAERRLLVGGVAAAHLLALWGLLQLDVVRSAMRDVAPLMVDFVALTPPKPEPPAPPVPPAPPRPQPQRPPVQPPPVLSVPPAPQAAPATFVVPPPVEPVPVVEQVVAPAPVAAPAPPAPPPPPAAPRQIPVSEVAYLVPPPIELPMASRRLNEEGTVLLRVLVGTDGQPRQVSLQRSSDHGRLDEQAMWAMKRARFKPQMENGVAIEWIVIAPLQYELQ
ncbi:MAG: energy transducer TonB [Rubrivivax sp.]